MASLNNRLINWAMAKPNLVTAIHACVDFIPPVRFAIERRVAIVMDENNPSKAPVNTPNTLEENDIAPLLDAKLTPFGKSIYSKLNTGIEASKKISI